MEDKNIYNAVLVFSFTRIHTKVDTITTGYKDREGVESRRMFREKRGEVTG